MLDSLRQTLGIDHIIEGEAAGADMMAKHWAAERGIPFTGYPANWFLYHRAAGPIRNKQMLTEGKPDMVVAFHGDIWSSKGTQNMVMQALGAGLPVMIFPGIKS